MVRLLLGGMWEETDLERVLGERSLHLARLEAFAVLLCEPARLHTQYVAVRFQCLADRLNVEVRLRALIEMLLNVGHCAGLRRGVTGRVLVAVVGMVGYGYTFVSRNDCVCVCVGVVNSCFRWSSWSCWS